MCVCVCVCVHTRARAHAHSYNTSQSELATSHLLKGHMWLLQGTVQLRNALIFSSKNFLPLLKSQETSTRFFDKGVFIQFFFLFIIMSVIPIFLPHRVAEKTKWWKLFRKCQSLPSLFKSHPDILPKSPVQYLMVIQAHVLRVTERSATK